MSLSNHSESNPTYSSELTSELESSNKKNS